LDSRCVIGGICKLLEIIEEHPSEIAYDLRSRFNFGIQDIGISIPWIEAVRLIAVLLRDPSSWTQAAKNNWDYPVDRNWIVASHSYDLLAMVNSKKKPKPYPSPWPNANVNRLRPKKAQLRSQVLEKLRLMNPKE
jgi:hypothetical protein